MSDWTEQLCENPECGHHRIDHGPILGCQARTENVFCECDEYVGPDPT